jgi:polysaccharide biosynthesis protein PslG
MRSFRKSVPILAALTLVAVCLPSVVTAQPAGTTASRKGPNSAATPRKRVFHERIGAAGVYDVTVVLTATAHSGVVKLTIGTVERRASKGRRAHRAVVRQRVTLGVQRLTIRASSPSSLPLIAISWRRVSAAAAPSPGVTRPSRSTPPSVPSVTPTPSPTGGAAVGINVAANSGDYFTSPAVLAAIEASKPAWVRVFIGWNAIEPQQGVYNTAEIQRYQRFFAALPTGTKVDVDVVGTPPWAAGGSTHSSTPPTDATSYAAFLSYLVTAFHGRVSAWEVWNEADAAAWWSGTVAQYAGLLKAAYPAIKSADPNATVILGGLTGNDATYLDQLYAAGAQGSFDAVGVHTDTACNVTSPSVFEHNRGTQTINQYFFLGFTAVHATMAANGDGANPIYITELGWSSTTAQCQTGAWAGQKLAGVTEPVQAAYLQQAYHCLAQPQYSYVKAAMWFELTNNGPSTAPLDNFGLLDAGYFPKAAFAAFEQESLQGDQLTGPCG